MAGQDLLRPAPALSAKVRTEHTRHACRASSFVSVPAFSLATCYNRPCRLFKLYSYAPRLGGTSRDSPPEKHPSLMAAELLLGWDAFPPKARTRTYFPPCCKCVRLKVRSGCPQTLHRPPYVLLYRSHRPSITTFISAFLPVSVARRIFLAKEVPSCLQMASADTVFLQEIFLPDSVQECISLDLLAVLPPPL